MSLANTVADAFRAAPIFHALMNHPQGVYRVSLLASYAVLSRLMAIRGPLIMVLDEYSFFEIAMNKPGWTESILDRWRTTVFGLEWPLEKFSERTLEGPHSFWQLAATNRSSLVEMSNRIGRTAEEFTNMLIIFFKQIFLGALGDRWEQMDPLLSGENALDYNLRTKCRSLDPEKAIVNRMAVFLEDVDCINQRVRDML